MDSCTTGQINHRQNRGDAVLKILIACEFSGIVRDEFAARGHDSVSCDLLPSERQGKHYQGDVFDIINDGWGQNYLIGKR